MALKPGKKPLAVPRIKRSIYIRVDLLAELDLILLDPMRSRAKYGAWTEYIEELVEKDLAQRRKVMVESGSIS